MIAAAAIFGAVVAFSFAIGLLWIAWCETARLLKRRKNRRKGPGVPRLDGSHEACHLTDKDRLIFGRYATRYAGLGAGVQNVKKGEQ